jgi:hypothetical protein
MNEYNAMPLERMRIKDGAFATFNISKIRKTLPFNQFNFYSFKIHSQVHINFDYQFIIKKELF